MSSTIHDECAGEGLTNFTTNQPPLTPHDSPNSSEFFDPSTDPYLEHWTTNEVGRVRQKPAQSYFYSYLDRIINFSAPIDVYIKWKNENDYLVLQKQIDLKNGTIERITFGVKCSKRGNNVYIDRLIKRLEGLYDIGKVVGKGKVYASFLTLTCDPSQYGYSKVSAWEDFSKRWNRIISWMRKLYEGFIGFFRVYESTKKGYPHIHAILFFDRKTFLPKKKLDSLWKSWTWIKSCRNVKGSVGYLIKYLEKGFTEKTHMLTPTLLWLFRKQSFGVSKAIFHLIQATMHNSNLFQITLDGKQAYDIKIIVIGIFSDDELREKSGGLLKMEGWERYIELDFLPEHSVFH